MFDHSRDVTITGGTFTVINSEPQGDFRTIRIGDINLVSLVKEDDVMENRVVVHRKRRARVHRQQVRVGARRMYHARVFGSPDIFTVVEYTGDLNEWRKKCTEELRHPNHVQIFGITNSSRIHAVVYHDELIPAKEAVAGCPSPLSSRLMNYVLAAQYFSFVRYLHDNIQDKLDVARYLYSRAEWFRVSAGQLCVELDRRDTRTRLDREAGAEVARRLASFRVITPAKGYLSDHELLASLSLEDLLTILCYRPEHGWPITPYYGSVQLATVYTVDERLRPSRQRIVPYMRKNLSFPASTKASKACYYDYWGHEDSGGWKRVPYDAIKGWLEFNSDSPTLHLSTHGQLEGKLEETWLQYATTMGSSSFVHGESYFLATSWSTAICIQESLDPFQLAGTFMTGAAINDLSLYLFLLIPEPYTDRNGVWVDIPSFRDGWFWASDPDGDQRLSEDECIGLPEVIFSAELNGTLWTSEDAQVVRDWSAVHNLDLSRFADVGAPVVLHDLGALLVDDLKMDAESCS
ncbi:hypothetical protein C8F01DRAFT_1177707 [Mycena amicta]|nr:hypothetical protein C8F01DRAFT_1177707 [Mycena amicta]